MGMALADAFVLALEADGVRRDAPVVELLARPLDSLSRGVEVPPATILNTEVASDVFRLALTDCILDARLGLRWYSSGGLNRSS